MKCMSLIGMGACALDPDFRASLPFACSDIDRDTIPATLRRRSSQAMQMAFSAATIAFTQADRSPSNLPTVFASVAGEIQTTDQLCKELAKIDGIISPSAFHNSVQNAVAGYWSIAHQCTQSTSALAAGVETFAMGLLEAWCQLACQGGELLLVCYDERWPTYLAPGQGSPALAFAMVLAAGAADECIVQIGKPYHKNTVTTPDLNMWIAQMPILAAVPLLSLIPADAKASSTTIHVAPEWLVSIDLC